jgi:ABC-type multidrug transport system fused ATPase/permease subunit
MSPIRRLLRHLAPHRPRIVLSAALAALGGLLSVGTVGALVPILDLLLGDGGVERGVARLRGLGDLGASLADHAERFAAGDRVRALFLVLAALVALTLVKGAVQFAQEVLAGSIAERARLGLARRLFDRLTEHDESTLSRIGMGNLTARFSYDLDMTGKARCSCRASRRWHA